MTYILKNVIMVFLAPHMSEKMVRREGPQRLFLLFGLFKIQAFKHVVEISVFMQSFFGN